MCLRIACDCLKGQARLARPPLVVPEGVSNIHVNSRFGGLKANHIAKAMDLQANFHEKIWLLCQLLDSASGV
jgi:hypothetical protein